MLTELTPSQTERIEVYRRRYFAMATSVVPADRPRAEAAAKRLAEMAGATVDRVVWVASPEEGHATYKRECDPLWNSHSAAPWGVLAAALCASLNDSLLDSLRVSLRDSLDDSLCALLRCSPYALLQDSLVDSLTASFQDPPWTALYSFAVEILGVPCGERERELLTLHNEITASCYVLWVLPGIVILCERPASVEIQDGKLVDATWGDAPRHQWRTP